MCVCVCWLTSAQYRVLLRRGLLFNSALPSFEERSDGLVSTFSHFFFFFGGGGGIDCRLRYERKAQQLTPSERRRRRRPGFSIHIFVFLFCFTAFRLNDDDDDDDERAGAVGERPRRRRSPGPALPSATFPSLIAG